MDVNIGAIYVSKCIREWTFGVHYPQYLPYTARPRPIRYEVDTSGPERPQ